VLLLGVFMVSKWKLFPKVGYVLLLLELVFLIWILLTSNLGADPVLIIPFVNADSDGVPF